MEDEQRSKRQAVVEIQHSSHVSWLYHRSGDFVGATILLRAAMTALTQRIKNGSGADEKLDDAIWRAFEPVPYPRGFPPKFTSDLNAVFALVERELPEWDYMSGRNSLAKKKYYVVLSKYNPTGADPLVLDRITEAHDDHCRALLLALLAAKGFRP